MRELARIKQARLDLMAFIGRTFPHYKKASHNLYLAEKLMAVERGEITRLMVSLPPRYGKSEEICRFIAWYLGKHPDSPIIYASYGSDLAVSKSRHIQRIVGSAEFQEVFPGVVIAGDVRSAQAWEIEGTKGGVLAAGVGSGITGRGFKIGVLDDLIKDRAEANSRRIREYTWEWWQSTFYTRMEEFGAENAAIVFIMTRWHPDDPAGRMLREMKENPGADRWEVVRLPAIAEQGDLLGREMGEALWPEKHSLEDLERIRANIGQWEFEALYQQNPRPKEGGLFQSQWFEIVDEAPADCFWVRYWDLAATEERMGNDPDWTAGGKVGFKSGIWYIGDMRRIRGTPLDVERLIRQTAELDGKEVKIWIEQEGGASGKNTIDYYRRNVLAGFSFRGNPATASKEDRADPVSSAAEAGNVKVIRGVWNREFLDEIEKFPMGGHDDQVDTVSGAFEVMGRKCEPDIFLAPESVPTDPLVRTLAGRFRALEQDDDD